MIQRNTLPMPVRSYVVIPARLESTRLPKKMLLRDTGKTLLQHTYEAALRARKPLGVCVATDSAEIANEVRGFGGRLLMTSHECASGTDRVAEASSQLGSADVIINVQGDEPELDPEAIDEVVLRMEREPWINMATLATPIRNRALLEDPACVKVVFNEQGEAIYFSRSIIPSISRVDEGIEDLLQSDPPIWHQHIGVYAYRRAFLIEIASCPQTELEKRERLEQLRVIERGERIAVACVESACRGIDTPEDYSAFVARNRAA